MKTVAVQMKKPILILATGLLISLHLHAVADVTIRGSVGCGTWLEAKGWPRAGYEGWLVGYLSGQAVGTGKDILKGTDSASLNRWMDNYCNANPLATVGNGGVELAEQLHKMKNPR
jgi:hypothetical protein